MNQKKEGKVKSFFKDFGEFIKRGNVIDLAVAFIIGAAFQAIVKSLVNDIIMPICGLLVGKDISQWKALLKGTEGSPDAVYMNYGNFIQEVINFFIIAFTIFVAVRIAMKFSAGLKTLKSKIIPESEEASTEENNDTDSEVK